MPVCLLDKEEVFTGEIYTVILFEKLLNKDYALVYSTNNGKFAISDGHKYSSLLDKRSSLALVKKNRRFIKKVMQEASVLGVDGRSLFVKLEDYPGLLIIGVVFTVLASLLFLASFPLSTLLVLFSLGWLLFR